MTVYSTTGMVHLKIKKKVPTLLYLSVTHTHTHTKGGNANNSEFFATVAFKHMR